MTLVELLVAIAVMLIVLAGVAAGASSGLRLARGNSNRIIAANIADQQISEVRAMDFASIPQSTVTGTVTQGAVEYTWTRDAEMVHLGAEESCEAPPGVVDASRLSYLRVIVEVTWPRMEGIEPVRSETVIDPPVAEFDRTRGHMSVRVRDRDGAPVPGMTVHLRNADSATPTRNTFQTTDEQGCAFFADLPVIAGQSVGHYHVWLNRSGWVDRDTGLTDTSAQQPRPVIDVVAAQLRKLEFSYDRAARLQVSLAGRFGGVPADNLPVTIHNDNYNNGNGPLVFASTAALAAQPLHPFPAGFSVWAGGCADADPGDAGRLRLPSNPGQTSTGVVQMGSVAVEVQQRLLLVTRPLSGATIVAHSPSCPTLGPYTVSGGRTDGNGRTVVALPYGQWRLQVQGRQPHLASGGWPTVTLSPADTAAPARTVTVSG